MISSCWWSGSRRSLGRSLLRVFLFGDTDEGGDSRASADEFAAKPSVVLKQMWTGGVSLPWNLAAAALIGLWLMFTRLTLGAEGSVANVDHVLGALVLAVVSIAAADVARALRYLLVPLALALVVLAFWNGAPLASMLNSIACGIALALLSLRRGDIAQRYGSWQRFVV
jgi:hypothetical protein